MFSSLNPLAGHDLCILCHLSHEQDKHEPNDYRTAKRVVESIEDALTEEDMAARVSGPLMICQY